MANYLLMNIEPKLNQGNKLKSNNLTGEELVEKAIEEEEMGDRWLEADLSKSLRFYQRSYECYVQALFKHIESDEVKFDVLYNISRLLFHVYTEFCATEGTNIADLSGIENVTQSPDSVIKPLEEIVLYHERAFEFSKDVGHISLDLLYNIIIAYTAVIEKYNDDSHQTQIQMLQMAAKGQEIIKVLLEKQTALLRQFVEDISVMQDNADLEDNESLSNNEYLENNAIMEDTNKKDVKLEVISEKVIQPDDAFETVLEGYKLVQATLENVESDSELVLFQQFMNPLIRELTDFQMELCNDYSEATNRVPDYLASISEVLLGQAEIAVTYIKGLVTNDLDEIIRLWGDIYLPDTPEKYMVFTDNLQEYLDRNDLNLTTCKNGDQHKISLFWKILTLMNNNLKIALEKLKIEKETNAEDKSRINNTLVNLMIQRSDVDIQRCQLKYEQGSKELNILLQNAKVFLKNGMMLANTSSGLREKISEKALRNHRKVECVLRMCILEGKTSVFELDSILGPSIWRRHLRELKKLDYFDDFLGGV